MVPPQEGHAVTGEGFRFYLQAWWRHNRLCYLVMAMSMWTACMPCCSPPRVAATVFSQWWTESPPARPIITTGPCSHGGCLLTLLCWWQVLTSLPSTLVRQELACLELALLLASFMGLQYRQMEPRERRQLGPGPVFLLQGQIQLDIDSKRTNFTRF